MIPIERLLLGSTAILLIAGAVNYVALRQRSAAQRHLVWLAALLSLTALPAGLWLPRWEPPDALATAVSRTVIYVTGTPDQPNTPARLGSLPAVQTFSAIWLAGAVFGLLRLVHAHRRLRAVVARATPYEGSPDVRISEETAVPFVHGVAEPVIVLPAAALHQWTPEHLDLVLAHERMHIHRSDNRWHTLASVAAALYWPQPLVWLATRLLRQECERACDDGVLANGTPATDYAGVLVQIARAAAQQQTALPAAGGIAMLTRPSQLKNRVEALLATRIDRRPAGRRFAATAAGVALATALAITGLEAPRLFAQTGRFAGVVRDASGASIPKARVDLSAGPRDSTTLHEILYTNDAGEFSFANIPDGVYSLTVLKPGFAALTHANLQFEGGKAKPLELTLQLGRIRETVTVNGNGAPTPPTPPAATTTSAATPPTRIRVGGNVQAAKVLNLVKPIYPPDAKQERVDGTVLFRAIIGLDGGILNIETLNRSVDARLVTAALDAVKQWRYQPTLLNGKPVEIITEIEVNFTLSQ